MASRATTISFEVRTQVINAILRRHSQYGFVDREDIRVYFLRYVGDGVFPDPENREEVDFLASHSATLAISNILQKAEEKRLSVSQTLELLRAALPYKS